MGGNPTFKEDDHKFEVHIIGFEGNLYGQIMEVDMLSRIRGTVSFESAAQLKSQLQQDVAEAREIATEYLMRSRG